MSCSLLQPYCQSFQLKITNTSVKKQWPWKSYDWLPPSAILSANTPTLVPVLDRERARLRGHKAVARVELRKREFRLFSSSHCDVHLHERFVVWWTTVWTVKIYCRDHEGNWIHAVVLLLTVRISFCFLHWFVWQNLASKPILCTYLSAVKSLLPCVV